MKKRLGMLAVVAALAVSMLSVPVQAKGADSYPDVGEGAWFYQVVTDVTEKGYMNGYDTAILGLAMSCCEDSLRQYFIIWRESRRQSIRSFFRMCRTDGTSRNRLSGGKRLTY